MTVVVFYISPGSPFASVTPDITARHEKIPLRLPVLREATTLQLIMPAVYTSLDQVPVPTNPLISIRSVPERNVAVLTFYGNCKRSQYMIMLDELRAMMVKDKMIESDEIETRSALVLEHDLAGKLRATPTASASAEVQANKGSGRHKALPPDHWTVAQYNSRATLRCWRRNEVWIDLNPHNTNAAELIRGSC